MSIKRLKRYRTNNAPAVADSDGCWVADYAVTELEATNAELVKALEEIKRHLLEANPHCGRIYLFERISNAFEIADKALASAKGDNHDS